MPAGLVIPPRIWGSRYTSLRRIGDQIANLRRIVQGLADGGTGQNGNGDPRQPISSQLRDAGPGRGRARSISRTATSRRPRSCRWRRAARSRRSSRGTWRNSASRWCWATPSISSSPRSGADRRVWRADRFMRWPGPIITDSGGFQIFSMGHGESPTRSRVALREGSLAPTAPRDGSILAIEEQGVRFRSYIDGTERFLGPEDVDGDAGGDRVRHRARARRVHTVSPRATTTRLGRWSARTAGWDRCLRVASSPNGPREPGECTRSSRAATFHDLRMVSTAAIAASRERRGRDRRLARAGQGADVRGGRLDDGRARAPRTAAPPPPAWHR